MAVADSLRTRLLLSLAYGCGLRASEVVRLKIKHIDSAHKIIRIEQAKGRNVMLSPELLDLLRLWWGSGHRVTARQRHCRTVAVPGQKAGQADDAHDLDRDHR